MDLVFPNDSYCTVRCEFCSVDWTSRAHYKNKNEQLIAEIFDTRDYEIAANDVVRCICGEVSSGKVANDDANHVARYIRFTAFRRIYVCGSKKHWNKSDLYDHLNLIVNGSRENLNLSRLKIRM